MLNNKCLSWLLVVYVVLFTILAFNPVNRSTWFAENLTVWIIVAIILILYARNIRFSNTSYVLMFVLIYLHTIGGHWTFAQVPFGFITDLFGFERNHFDRIAHFSVGFYAYPIAEWIVSKKLVSSKFIVFTYPIFAIATIAMSYELVEWLYVLDAPPGLGDAYLGSQGDEWDAQKDMLADTLGAITATIFYMVRRTLMKSDAHTLRDTTNA